MEPKFMKLWKRLIYFFTISSTLIYLSGVFIIKEWDLFKWLQIERTVFIMLTFGCTIILNIIYLGEKDKL